MPSSDDTNIRLRCLQCDYALDHLKEKRCPECGRGFDPADRQTYWTHDRPKYALLSPRQLFIFTLVTITFDFAAFFALHYGKLAACVVPWVMVILHITLGSYAIVALFEDRKRRWSVILFALVVAMLALPFAYLITRFSIC